MFNQRFRHSGPFAFEAQVPPADPVEGDDENAIVIPEDLTVLSDEELDALESELLSAFDIVYGDNPTTADAVATLEQLASGSESVKVERDRRATVLAENQAAAEAAYARMHPPEPEPEPEPEVVEPEPIAEAVREPQAVAAAAVKVPAAPAKGPKRINVPMSEVAARAPQPDVPERLAILAAADVPRFAAGHEFRSIGELGEAMRERAQSAPLTASGNLSGPKVATIRHKFQHVLNRDTPPSEVERIMGELTHPDVLVAAGGWCAPSEVSYSFFNVTCEDGMIDLPTFGVDRGGIRWPVSPSLADVFTGTFTNATNPWLWTETDDILTVTGSTNKPCVRVPCPTFDERRLECYGICLTAGNLTDSAFPEATENQLALLNSAHYHAQNMRYIAQMVTQSTVVATGGMFNDAGSLASDLLTAVEWGAIDYRTRYGMCDDDILEVVLPTWGRAAFRADLAQRTGIDMLNVTDSMINNWFDTRSVRVQWVKDWQVRGTNQPGGASPTTLLPASIQFMLYAAGTFVKGNGMTLELGVVRDSVLNAENDHTAAWTEECHLIAKLGHESRLYTVGVCAAGRTGIANLADCRTA